MRLALLLSMGLAMGPMGCYGPPDPPECRQGHMLDATGGDCEAFRDMVTALPLTHGALSRDFVVVLHPDSDGGAFAPTERQRADGYTEIYAQTWCGSQRIEVASADWTSERDRNRLCHEVGHALLCTRDAHETMKASGYEAECTVAMGLVGLDAGTD